jgi:hypothetical protein
LPSKYPEGIAVGVAIEISEDTLDRLRATHEIDGAVLDEPLERALLAASLPLRCINQGGGEHAQPSSHRETHRGRSDRDAVMDEQIFRFLAAFTQIGEENLRERLIKITEWISRNPDSGSRHREQLGQALNMRSATP